MTRCTGERSSIKIFLAFFSPTPPDIRSEPKEQGISSEWSGQRDLCRAELNMATVLVAYGCVRMDHSKVSAAYNWLHSLVCVGCRGVQTFQSLLHVPQSVHASFFCCLKMLVQHREDAPTAALTPILPLSFNAMALAKGFLWSQSSISVAIVANFSNEIPPG
jgi:hypothetical protein